MTTSINYQYSVRGSWLGPADEKPAVTGAKFLQTLDALSDIDPVFSGWQFTGAWQISEEHRSNLCRWPPGANVSRRLLNKVSTSMTLINRVRN